MNPKVTTQGEKLVARVPMADLAEGKLLRITYPPFDVVITLVDGVPRALEDACNHAGASLTEGYVRGGDRIVCPMHGYVFSLTDGALLAPRGLCAAQRTFEVRVEGGEALIYDTFVSPVVPA